jgi:tetratricopeptide (TPR) repeat protein
MPHDSIETESRALTLLQQGRTRAALAATTVGLCREVNAARLWLLRAQIHHAAGDWGKALADVEQAMTLAPLPVDGQLLLADCCSLTGRHELALVAYEHLLDTPDQKPAVYAEVYAGLVRCGRRDLALRCCRVAVEFNPEDHAALFAMAHCMVVLNYDAVYVAAVLRQAVQAAPDNEVYRISLAIQHARCERHAEAHAQLKAASPERLSLMSCACSVRYLLRACLWAGDHQRASLLSVRMRWLLSNYRRQPGE